MRLAFPFARSLVVLALVWQAAVGLFALPRYLLPTPLEVLTVFQRQPGFLIEQSLVTVAEMLAGLAAGTVFGVATAIGLAAFPRVGKLVWPFVLVLQAFPVFVIAPLLVVWFGFGMVSKIVMAAIIIFFPVVSAFSDGLRRTDAQILDAVALTKASHWQALWLVRLPLALPGLVTGLRVAAPLAPLGAVVGEWVGASAGLGFVIVQANARMQTDVVFAAMAILAVLAVLLRLIVEEATRPLAHWARET